MSNIDFTQVFLAFSVLLLSLTVHEAAHAWSADRLGDATARMLGRVSLNPAVHIDPIGTLLFPLLAIVTGLPVIGWAKPVPVNILNLRGDWRTKYMAIAAAGPSSNIALAVVAAALLHVLNPPQPFFGFLRLAVVLNVLLAVFNLIPVPPLDGGNVLAGVLRGPAADFFDRLRPYGFLILYALLLTGALWTIVTPPMVLILRALGVG